MRQNSRDGSLKYYKLPFVNGGSIDLKKILEDVHPKVRMAFGNFNMLKSRRIFSTLKDKIPLWKNSSLVYRLPCSDYSAVYIGETIRYLKKRLYSHKYNCNHPDKDSTALADHIDFENVTIAAREENYHRRKICEIIEIIKEKNLINYKSDSVDTYTFYAYFFD